MAPFLSDEELRQRGGDDVVEYVYDLRQQLETHKARADAAVINAEQTCALIEQKFLSLTTQFTQVENEKHQSIATLERRSGELGQAQSQIHKLELDAIKHESDLERISFELNEAKKSRRDLLDIVEQKNTELEEKRSAINAYLEKIVTLTDELSSSEGKAREREAEFGRSQAVQARLQQEKELLEKHNQWLNEELNNKMKGLMEERRTSADLEADLQSKLLQAERLYKETKESLQKSNERTTELEAKLSQTREELRYTREQAILQENHLSTEITTATKLADLYKQSSEEWSSKSIELEGVIKALETHLNQVEADYREKLENEVKAREAATRETSELKEKLEKAQAAAPGDTERDGDILSLAAPPAQAMAEPTEKQLALEIHAGGAILPSIGKNISGTALAAALLRDGWSLSTMYSKYQEAIDAWRHERHERRQSQALLERVLHEIELKAEVIFDERAEHERMVQAYHVMEDKLHYSMADQSTLENSIKDLKAELRKKEREVKGAQKEISDLQTQVAGLLKECAEVKQRFEAADWHPNGEALPYYATSEPDNSAANIVISEKLVTFKDIRGMVEQNSQLRVLVRNLAEEAEQKEAELKEYYSAELKRRADDAARKVAETLKKYKEKTEIVETLQATVSMYKRLYEEELKSRYISPAQISSGAMPVITSEGDGKDYGRLLLSSQEEVRRVREETDLRIKNLEEDLAKTRQELTDSRLERARVDVEAAVARDQMSALMKEAENRRREMEGVLTRNMEFSQTITDYQQRLRESSQKMQAAEELAHKLKIEIAVLEKEKTLLAAAEKRASEEVGSLSDRVHRLQASDDTRQSVDEVRESMRTMEMKKLQDDWNHMQKEWADGKKELEAERSHSRNLIVSRDKAVKEAMDRVEAVGKELAEALKAMSAAETRAQVAEVRCTELEASLKSANDKISMALSGGKRSDTGEKSTEEIDAEILAKLQEAREELEQVKEELVASKGHTEQYKRIAEANEEALKQLEAAHNKYKSDVEHMKEVLESDVNKLREKISSLEAELTQKETNNTSKIKEKEAMLRDVRREMATIQESLTSTQAALQGANEKVNSLQKEVEKYHHQWRDAQRNYERQVLLQADTIRELTHSEEKLTNLEESEASMRKQAEIAEAQLASAQVAWAMEKSALGAAKDETEKRSRELEEQNKLLLDRLEAMHITSAEQSRKELGEAGKSSDAEDKEENDLQNVIRYLRRSKETAETEVSLLKQERLRLQRQLDAASRAAEDAQAALRREQESARTSLYSDEEFRSLQAQLRELNLLRESNTQLREENRRNFEDARESREKMRLAVLDLEPLQTQLKEKEIELESAGKELEMQKAETQRWQSRVSQLLEKYKAIDVDEYQRVKTEIEELQESTKALRSGLEAATAESEVAKRDVETTQSKCEKLESEINEKDNKISELEKNGETVKGELDKFKRHATFQKRRIENLMKEKDEMSKENENLSKQIEELRATAGRRTVTESRQEVASRQETAARLEQVQREQREQDTLLKEKESTLKERDVRIQTLEKILEKERESLRKERAMRERDRKTFMDLTQKAAQEKKRIESELETLRRAEAPGAGTTEVPIRSIVETVEAAGTPIAEASVASQETVPQSQVPQPAAVSGSEGLPQTSVETSNVSVEAGQNNVLGGGNGTGPRQTVRNNMTNATSVSVRPSFRPPPPPPQGPPSEHREKEMAQLRREIEERERNASSTNSISQARKSTRRLIRPRIEPAGQQESAPEAGEIVGEGTGEISEADVEFLEQGKPSAAELDSAQIAPTSEAGAQIHADAGTLITEATLQPSTSVSAGLTTVASVPARKRPAYVSDALVTDDNISDQEVRQEGAPPQKRARPVEQVSEMVAEEGGSLPSTSLSGAKAEGGSGQGTQETTDDVSGVLAPTEDVVQALTPLADTDRERPVAETSDTQPQKRPRFIRPELLLIPEQSATRENEAQESEKTDTVKQDESGGVSRESDNAVVVLTNISSEAPVMDFASLEEPGEVPLQVDQATEQDRQPKSPMQSTVGSLGEGSQVADDGLTGLDTDMNEPISIEEDVQPPTGGDSSGAEYGEITETEAAAIDIPKGYHTTSSETVTIEEVHETQMEEGEMVAEVMVTETVVEAVSEVVSVDERPVAERNEVIVQEIATGVYNEQEAGVPSAENRDIPSTDDAQAGSSHTGNDAVGATEGSAEEQKATEEQAPGRAITRAAAVRTTTIHLAERARERAVLRRGGLNPPSPAARGGRGRTQRGGKRAPVGARGAGRVISTGVRGRGQAGGSPGQSGDSSRQGTQSGAGAAGPSDNQQASPTRNISFDGASREGEDH
ncbi:hypothetical protein R1sor_020688 [Riccia sorocarpa]|uniref:Nucleoprotein TPR/MLP1 domain-containing protein n=1 Tax=Riccia sorocarpa TaxID=122646 RepID=A0ABD3GEW0_9MARC